jgi:uncharacterized protein
MSFVSFIADADELIFVYGRYERDLVYVDPDVNLRIERADTIPVYVRECKGARIEKYLAADYDAVYVCPVEPVNLPQEITHHLEIAFPTIVLPPAAKKIIYLKFPVEIGVFFEIRREMSVLDIFSLVPTKFSLYGLPGMGVITRWYRSDIFPGIPVTDPHREGVLELSLVNRCTTTVEISRAVFDSYHMNLFYGERVGMTATMEVLSPVIALTTFAPVVSAACPNSSIDLYTSRKFAVGPGKGYMMESGMA